MKIWIVARGYNDGEVFIQSAWTEEKNAKAELQSLCDAEDLSCGDYDVHEVELDA